MPQSQLIDWSVLGRGNETLLQKKQHIDMCAHIIPPSPGRKTINTNKRRKEFIAYILGVGEQKTEQIQHQSLPLNKQQSQ